AIFARQLNALRGFGNRLHNERVAESLDCLRQAAKVLPQDRHLAMDAYVRGWLCHFFLDSITHPQIIFYERTLCSVGYQGLGPDASSEVHAQIESDLDSMLLYRRNGQTIKTFRPTSEILLASDTLLDWIGVMYRRVADEVFHINMPAQTFRRGVKMMRASYDLIYSPGGTMRTLVGAAERIGRKHSLMQALSHRVDVGIVTDFDNHHHETWINPFSGERSEASFMDLYRQAVNVAVQRQEQFTGGEDSIDLVGALNFLGSPVQ
ncbi:MAG: hypothetical protein FWH50_02255, partial [Coriobacteriia bacterium]|nr:hypothetical protein [Coriobacteriia bacterium]